MQNSATQTAVATANPPIAPPQAASIKYCLYARKSSEDDERQALSIESQIKEMLATAERDGLNIVEVRRESHSAKASGMRPVYNRLVEEIRAGFFNGILTWAPDRLSRNAGDLGAIVDLMDQGALKEIRTHGQRFTNSPNEKFLLMILCSQAKLENDNRGINVKRGQRSKLEMGHRPCLAPLGYLNEKLTTRGESKILIDPERAPIITEMFNKVAFKHYTGRDLYEWINEETNFTTRAGKKLALSVIYRVLQNPFYYGKFEWPVGSGKWYEGKYKPLITKELFDKVRENLAVAPKSRPGTKEFNFTKLMRCGACGSGITAEEKFKKLSDGTVNRYVYYKCTKFANHECEEPSIREEELTTQLLELMDKIDLDELGARKKVQEEIEKYKRFSQGVFGKMMTQEYHVPQVDVKNYAKFVLQNGTRDEKRDLLACLKSKIFLKKQKIYINKKRAKETE